MQKKKLGNTNIHLSSLGFGAAPIGDLDVPHHDY